MAQVCANLRCACGRALSRAFALSREPRFAGTEQVTNGVRAMRRDAPTLHRLRITMLGQWPRTGGSLTFPPSRLFGGSVPGTYRAKNPLSPLGAASKADFAELSRRSGSRWLRVVPARPEEIWRAVKRIRSRPTARSAVPLILPAFGRRFPARRSCDKARSSMISFLAAECRWACCSAASNLHVRCAWLAVGVTKRLRPAYSVSALFAPPDLPVRRRIIAAHPVRDSLALGGRISCGAWPRRVIQSLR